MGNAVNIDKNYIESKNFVKNECAKILALRSDDNSGLQKLKLVTDSESSGLYFPECIKRQYDYLYDVMIKHGEIYGGFYEIKDLLEMVIKIPVIIFLYGMTDYIINDGGDGTEDIRRSSFGKGGKYSPKILEFYNIILGKAPAFGDWEVMCAKIAEIKDINRIPIYEDQKAIYLEVHNILKNLKEEYYKFSDLNGKKGNISTYRNDKLGHGATNLEIEEFFEDFKHILKKLNKILTNTEYPKDFVFSVDNDGLKLSYSSITLDINPYILFHRDNKEEVSLIESFNDAKKDALLLNYVNGVKWPNKELYEKLHYVKERLSIIECTDEDMNAYKISKANHLASLKIYNKETTAKNSVFIDVVNQFLEKRRKNKFNNGILLLEAERGMGKSVFARLLSDNDEERVSSYQKGCELSGNRDILVWSYLANGNYGSTLRAFTRSLLKFINKILENIYLLEDKMYENVYSEMLKITNIDDTLKQKEVFEKYLTIVMEQLGDTKELVLFIDGLDEINEDKIDSLRVVDLLSDIRLPENLYFILLGRTVEEYKPMQQVEYIADEVVSVRRSNSEYYNTLYKYAWKFIVNKELGEEKIDLNNAACKKILEIADYRFIYIDLIRRMYDMTSKYLMVSDFLNLFIDYSSKKTDKVFLKLYFENMLFIGEKYHNALLKILLILAICPVELTLKNINYLCFNDDRETFKIKALLNDLTGFLQKHRSLNDVVYVLENEIWRNELLSNEFVEHSDVLKDELILRLKCELMKESFGDGDLEQILILLSIVEFNSVVDNEIAAMKILTMIDACQKNNSIYYHEMIINILEKLKETKIFPKNSPIYVNLILRKAYSYECSGKFKELQLCINDSDILKYYHEYNKNLSSDFHEKNIILTNYLFGVVRGLESKGVIQEKSNKKLKSDLWDESDDYFLECLKRIKESCLMNDEGIFGYINTKTTLFLLDSYNAHDNNDYINESRYLCEYFLNYGIDISRELKVNIYNHMYETSIKQKYLAVSDEVYRSKDEESQKWILAIKSSLPNDIKRCGKCDVTSLKNLFEYYSDDYDTAISYISKAIEIYELLVYGKNIRGEYVEISTLADMYYSRIEYILKTKDRYDKRHIIQDLERIKNICQYYKTKDNLRYSKDLWWLEEAVYQLELFLNDENSSTDFIDLVLSKTTLKDNLHIAIARECLFRSEQSMEGDLDYVKGAIFHFEKAIGIDRSKLVELYAMKKYNKFDREYWIKLTNVFKNRRPLVEELIEMYQSNFDNINYYYPVSISQISDSEETEYLKAAIVLTEVKLEVLSDVNENTISTQEKDDLSEEIFVCKYEMAYSLADLGLLSSKKDPNDSLYLINKAITMLDALNIEKHTRKSTSKNIVKQRDAEDKIEEVFVLPSGRLGLSYRNHKLDEKSQTKRVTFNIEYGDEEYKIAALLAFKFKVLLRMSGRNQEMVNVFSDAKERLLKIINNEKYNKKLCFVKQDAAAHLLSIYDELWFEQERIYDQILENNRYVEKVVLGSVNEHNSNYILLYDIEDYRYVARRYFKGADMLFPEYCNVYNTLFSGSIENLGKAIDCLDNQFMRIVNKKHPQMINSAIKEYRGLINDLIDTINDIIQNLTKYVNNFDKDNFISKLYRESFPVKYEKMLEVKKSKLIAENLYYKEVSNSNFKESRSSLNPIKMLRCYFSKSSIKEKYENMIEANQIYEKEMKDYNLFIEENLIESRIDNHISHILDIKEQILYALSTLEKKRRVLGN